MRKVFKVFKHIEIGLIAIEKNDWNHEKGLRKEVHIGNYTFIGQNSLIMPGVTIGDNCIIGAGSIVNKDIPDRTVAAGIPVKIIDSIDNWANKKLQNDVEWIQ